MGPVPGMTVAEPSVQTTDFGGLTIAFDDRVLRPRAWTLAQSQWAEDMLAQLSAGPVLELCTGAGHIGLRAVAPHRRRLVAVDVNPTACHFVQQNAKAAGMADLVETRLGSMDEVLRPDETFPLIIADPPWVPRPEVGTYPEDPMVAIDGGDDGMEVVRSCLAVIRRHLTSRGVAVLQLGTVQQAEDVSDRRDSAAPQTIRMTELRTYDRGVLVRLDRVG